MNGGTILKSARGTLVTNVGKQFGATVQFISKILTSAKANKADPTINCHCATPQNTGNLLGNVVWDSDAVQEAIEELQLASRSSYKTLAKAMAMPATTEFKVCKRSDSRTQLNLILPDLTDKRTASHILF